MGLTKHGYLVRGMEYQRFTAILNVISIKKSARVRMRRAAKCVY